jgi:hypothetical protein
MPRARHEGGTFVSKKYPKPFANRDPDDLVTSEEYAKAIGRKSADSLRQR